jgi:hypothetical protein
VTTTPPSGTTAPTSPSEPGGYTTPATTEDTRGDDPFAAPTVGDDNRGVPLVLIIILSVLGAATAVTIPIVVRELHLRKIYTY